MIIYEFILYSLGIKDQTFFNYSYPLRQVSYDDDFSSDFLNKYNYITYNEDRIFRKIFR